VRVLLLNQTFHPDVAATAQHAHDLAVDLIAKGHQVSVITSRAIYGQRGGSLPKHEKLEGIDVHRVGGSIFGKGSTLARLIDFLLFYALATLKLLRLPRHDVVVPFTTPPLIVLAAVITRWFKRHRVVYWVMDLYPEVAVAHGMFKPRSLRTRLLTAISRWACRRCAAVVALGPCMKQRLIKHGVAQDKIEIISVWADREELSPIPRDANPLREAWNLSDDFVVMYSGNFGLAHDVDTILAAIDELHDEPGLRFLFVGSGKGLARLKSHCKTQGLNRVMIQPYQPREALNDSLNVGDVHLVSQTDNMNGLIVPCKLFGILAVARPVLYVGPDDAAVAQIIQESEAGSVILCGDTPALIEGIMEMKTNPALAQQCGEFGRATFEKNYDRRIATNRWATLLEQVCDSA
jgi:glycosyltransferase involved in cell wall biosynthesis